MIIDTQEYSLKNIIKDFFLSAGQEAATSDHVKEKCLSFFGE